MSIRRLNAIASWVRASSSVAWLDTAGRCVAGVAQAASTSKRTGTARFMSAPAKMLVAQECAFRDAGATFGLADAVQVNGGADLPCPSCPRKRAPRDIRDAGPRAVPCGWFLLSGLWRCAM